MTLLNVQREAALERALVTYQHHAALHPRSFLSVEDLSADEMKTILKIATDIKKSPSDFSTALKDQAFALLFQKNSTRTRCSFERAATELGATSTYIDWRTSNFTRADLYDETKVLSRYYDMIVARVLDHQTLLDMKAASEVPVINGLCNRMHPCQALGDYLTMMEYFGPDLESLRLAYIGDGNNVCRSLVHGAAKLGVHMTVCGPEGYKLDNATLNAASKNVSYVNHPIDAIRDADVLYTDIWVSMGQESEAEERMKAFAFYQVNAELIAHAPKHMLIMHCLPAQPGKEITAEVLRAPTSIVFDQAENRTHGQKALLYWLSRQEG